MKDSPVRAISTIIVIALVAVVSLFVIVPMLGLMNQAPDMFTSTTATTTATTIIEEPEETYDLTLSTSYGTITAEQALGAIEFINYWLSQNRFVIVYDENYNAPGGVYVVTATRSAPTDLSYLFMTNTMQTVLQLFYNGSVWTYEIDPDGLFFTDITYPETFHFILGVDV